jgi:hypothetical protein
VLKPPLNYILNRREDLIPGRFELESNFLPAYLSCPVGEKELVWDGFMMLSFCPGHLFHYDSTAQAIYSTRPIQKKYPQSPQRYELVTTLRKPIIAAARVAAARAHWFAVCTCFNFNFKLQTPLALPQSGRTVYERLEFIDPIQ